MSTETDDFIRSVRAFLDANAQRRPQPGELEWGTGPDRIAYFSAEPPEIAAAEGAQPPAPGSGAATTPASAGSAGRRSTAARA